MSINFPVAFFTHFIGLKKDEYEERIKVRSSLLTLMRYLPLPFPTCCDVTRSIWLTPISSALENQSSRHSAMLRSLETVVEVTSMRNFSERLLQFSKLDLGHLLSSRWNAQISFYSPPPLPATIHLHNLISFCFVPGNRSIFLEASYFSAIIPFYPLGESSKTNAICSRFHTLYARNKSKTLSAKHSAARMFKASNLKISM